MTFSKVKRWLFDSIIEMRDLLKSIRSWKCGRNSLKFLLHTYLSSSSSSSMCAVHNATSFATFTIEFRFFVYFFWFFIRFVNLCQFFFVYVKTQYQIALEEQQQSNETSCNKLISNVWNCRQSWKWPQFIHSFIMFLT